MSHRFHGTRLCFAALVLSSAAAVRADSPAGPLEEIETRDGRIFVGEVVGYDVASRSYRLLCVPDGKEVTVAENAILAIRPRSAGTSSAGAARAPTAPPPAPAPAPKLPEELAGLQAPTAAPPSHLDRLLADLSAYMAPADLAVRARFDAAVRLAREHRLQEALARLENGGGIGAALAADVLAAAILIENREQAAALPILLQAERRESGDPFVLEMLTWLTGRLGYLALEIRFGEAWVDARHQGPKRLLERCRFLRTRDPRRAAEAWAAYLAADPELKRLDGDEARHTSDGREALRRGDAASALRSFAAAAAANPFLREALGPERRQAMEASIEATLKSPAPIAAADLAVLAALSAEDPQRAAKESSVESAAVRRRLDEAVGIDGLRRAVDELASIDEELARRHQGLWRQRLTETARQAVTSGDADGAGKALAALKAVPGFGALPGSLLDEVERRCLAEFEAGRRASALRWAAVLEEASAPELAEQLRRRIGPAAPRPAEPAGAAPRNDAAAAAAAANASQARVAPEALAGYFPLSIGSSWNYYHGDGTRARLELERIDRQSVGSMYRFRDVVDFNGASVTQAKTAYFRDNALFLGKGTDPALAEPILAAPLAAGRRWSWQKGNRGEIRCEREVVALDVEVTCRAGSYPRCLKVRSSCWYEKDGESSPPVVEWHYFAPGVGLVKVETENPLDGREIEAFRDGGTGGG
jgi:hypothetical protein